MNPSIQPASQPWNASGSSSFGSGAFGPKFGTIDACLDLLPQTRCRLTPIGFENGNINILKYHHGHAKVVKVTGVVAKGVFEFHRHIFQTDKAIGNEKDDEQDLNGFGNFLDQTKGSDKDPEKQKGARHLHQGKGKGGRNHGLQLMKGRNEIPYKCQELQFFIAMHIVGQQFSIALLHNLGPQIIRQHNGSSKVFIAQRPLSMRPLGHPVLLIDQ
eukprot:scaffold69917_cov59-Attheya_sp.AAC.4